MENIITEQPDITLSRNQIAAALGVSVRTVERGNLVPVDKISRTPLFALSDVLAWHGDACAERARAKALRESEADGESISAARLRLTMARADAQEIANATSLGVLAPVDLLTSALSLAVAQLNSHLESVPAMVKRLWPEVPSHVLDSIDRGIAQLRNSIAESHIDLPDAPTEKDHSS